MTISQRFNFQKVRLGPLRRRRLQWGTDLCIYLSIYLFIYLSIYSRDLELWTARPKVKSSFVTTLPNLISLLWLWIQLSCVYISCPCFAASHRPPFFFLNFNHLRWPGRCSIKLNTFLINFNVKRGFLSFFWAQLRGNVVNNRPFFILILFMYNLSCLQNILLIN